MKRRAAATRGQPVAGPSRPRPDAGPPPAHTARAQPPGNERGTLQDSAGNWPVLVLSYAHSGAAEVQGLLAAGTNLACTTSTGVIPLAEAAAETWRRIEGQPGPAMSRLAVSTVRGLVSAQVTVILSAAGQSRWCELVTAPPGVVGPFWQVFPGTEFVCVHRSCPDVIRAGVRANPWGGYARGLMPYFQAYPGNNVAALAAYWVDSTEQLLAFEAENPAPTHRLRYEDVMAESSQVLAAARSSLRLDPAAPEAGHPGSHEPRPPAAGGSTAAGPAVPMDMMPAPLRQRVVQLHAELDYVPPGE